jgi:hypothetical protein
MIPMDQDVGEEKELFITKEMRPDVVEFLAIRSWDGKYLKNLLKIVMAEEIEH